MCIYLVSHVVADNIGQPGHGELVLWVTSVCCLSELLKSWAFSKVCPPPAPQHEADSCAGVWIQGLGPNLLDLVSFVVVPSLSHVQLFATP